MGAVSVIWHGTQPESTALVDAIAHNCQCKFGIMGVRLTTCSPHEMLLKDQRALDGLLFYRRIRACLIREENMA